MLQFVCENRRISFSTLYKALKFRAHKKIFSCA
uniref:Uncharacterized protein n=1 Tax=Myoviridae sp. ctFCq8 TaxID=2827605 RepID=A0A8S5LIK6_9CAUD|nr:MAG TPA: hypothetical protein [Myoviridae sp. ctFCq8]